MSTMLKRPPAKMLHRAAQPGPLTASVMAPNMHGAPPGDDATPRRDLGRQTFGAVDSSRAYGASSTTQRAIEYVWQLFTNLNPAHEQPKLIFNSGAQPFTVGMQLRRYSRTHMTAAPRFVGRWAYVGFIRRNYTERARMTGMPSRQGTTYVLPQFSTGPRAINLGPK